MPRAHEATIPAAMWVRWLNAFIFTQLVEVPIYVRFIPGEHRAARAFVASLVTHPIVWFVIPLLELPYYPYAFVAELFAWLTEAVYMHWLGVRRPLLVSLLANAASAGLGPICRELIGWP